MKNNTLKSSFEFLKQLARNNNRAWFTEHN
ncbi:MAG: DUF2461 family protein [Bergeyella sp.]